MQRAPMQMEAAPPTTGRRNPQQMNWKLAVVCCLFLGAGAGGAAFFFFRFLVQGCGCPAAFDSCAGQGRRLQPGGSGGDCFCGCDGGVGDCHYTCRILSTNASGHEFDEIQCYRGQERVTQAEPNWRAGGSLVGNFAPVGGGSCNFDFDSAEDTSVGGGCGPAADEPACPVCPGFAQSDACRCDAEDCNNAPDDRCRCPEARAATCCNNGR